MKAIQTVYKGYKFRSRLEARYAVFFDALGLDWEYEPEGYELPDGTWYLPDFFVPKQAGVDNDLFIEIKADSAFTPSMNVRSVYLAGKIKPKGEDLGMIDNWREKIADKSYLGNKHEFHSSYNDPDEDTLFRHDFAYCGPLFSDNHGCYIEHKRALSQIRRCDIFFAWINSHDAFGTFAEIGFAHSLGKEIYIGYDKSVDHKDMWFLSEMADDYGVFDCPRLAFDSLVPSNSPCSDDENKVSQFSIMAENKANTVLVLGDPGKGKAFNYHGGYCFPIGLYQALDFGLSNIANAAIKARQARFEHGETPL